MTTKTIIEERIIDHGERQSRCPCGCGNTGTDKSRTRARITEVDYNDGRGLRRFIEIAETVDGGGVWFNATQCPMSNTSAPALMTRYFA